MVGRMDERAVGRRVNGRGLDLDVVVGKYVER